MNGWLWAYAALVLVIAVVIIAYFVATDPNPTSGIAPAVITTIGVAYGVAWPILILFVLLWWTGRGLAALGKAIAKTRHTKESTSRTAAEQG